jgi:hypothetical protein
MTTLIQLVSAVNTTVRAGDIPPLRTLRTCDRVSQAHVQPRAAPPAPPHDRFRRAPVRFRPRLFERALLRVRSVTARFRGAAGFAVVLGNWRLGRGNFPLKNAATISSRGSGNHDDFFFAAILIDSSS